MGNCFQTLIQSTAEISPSDSINDSPPLVVTLYGSPHSALTSYVRFALLCKPLSLQFVPSDAPDFGSDSKIGLTKAANEEHARDLPLMNGIKEDIKSVGVLDSGSPVYQEALSNLLSRLKIFRERCKEHFEEEERHLLPLMEAAELGKEKQEAVVEQCLDAMQGTHSHLFRFFLEGLIPIDALHYLDLITTCCGNTQKVESMFHWIVE